MCNRYSCVQTRAGKVYDGRGLTHSHANIIRMHGLDGEDLALYEWQPPKDWPSGGFMAGLTLDKAPEWTRKASHDKALDRAIRKRYPDMAAWDAPDTIDADCDGQTFDIDGRSTLVLLSGEHTNPPWCMAGGDAVVHLTDSATMGYACGSATVTLADSATMGYAYDSATVTLADSATMWRACNSATVTLADSATMWYAYDSVTVTLADSATMRDARNSATVTLAGSAAMLGAYDSVTVTLADSATMGGAYDSVTVHDKRGKK